MPTRTASARGDARARPITSSRRVIYSITGVAMAFYGLRRKSLPGVLLALAGGGVALRGVKSENAARLLTGEQGKLAVERSITIQAPAGEVYRRFKDYESLPRLMRHLEEVTVLAEDRLRVKAHVLMGKARIEWVQEMVEDKEGSLLAWRSVEGSSVEVDGWVRFEEHDGATRVRLSLAYRMPAGRVGSLFGKALNPALAEEIKEDLRRLKAQMEAGEVPTIAGQPAGAGRTSGLTLVDKIGGKA